jgi:predicted hotdog family 3-hydroxylacyl-ACP dehydratase
LPVIFRAQLLAAHDGTIRHRRDRPLFVRVGFLAAVVALGSLGTGVAFVAMGALLVRVGARLRSRSTSCPSWP